MVSIDLTTLSGWGSLEDGTYAITVGAKAPGYTRVKQSSPVNVTKESFNGNYIRFSSENSFTLAKANTTKDWNGTIEYSTDTTNWNVWDGTTAINSGEIGSTHNIFLRGINNTIITGSGQGKNFSLAGANISLSGNLENLLDYATVVAGEHPNMNSSCFQRMFQYCSALTDISDFRLGSPYVYDYAYDRMFYSAGVVEIPSGFFAAIAVGAYAYNYMFYGCVYLTTLPSNMLPVVNGGGVFYTPTFVCQSMFASCTSLSTLPTNLLPATSLYCGAYKSMFSGCSSLESLPKLPATTIPESAYQSMFQGCSKIKVSTTQTGEYQNEYSIPSDGIGTETAAGTTSLMLWQTGGSFAPAGNVAINTTYYTSNAVV